MATHRLFRYFVALSIGAATAILILVGAGMDTLLHRRVIQNAQTEAVRLALTLRNSQASVLFNQDREGIPILAAPTGPQLADMDRHIRTFLDRFDIVAAAFHDVVGTTVYDTAPTGTRNRIVAHSPLAPIVNGTVRSELQKNVSVDDLTRNRREGIDLVRTLVPLVAQGGGIVGCVVIDEDVTAKTAAATITLMRSVGVLMSVMLAVFAMLTMLMRRATADLDASRAKLRAMNMGLEHQIEQRTETLTKTRDAVIFGLAKLAESRDNDTGDHLERIRDYTRILAESLAGRYSLDQTAIDTLCLATSLHDIGKVGVPDAILLKPGRLTPEERAVIQKHATIGGDCLLSIKQRLGADDFLQTACEIALGHHERWDGGGYPFGLKGKQIPTSARIVAVADVYDALTSDRVYKKAMSHQQARAIIIHGTRTQFDPAVINAFIACEDDFRHIAESQHMEQDQTELESAEHMLAATVW